MPRRDTRATSGPVIRTRGKGACLTWPGLLVLRLPGWAGQLRPISGQHRGSDAVWSFKNAKTRRLVRVRVALVIRGGEMLAKHQPWVADFEVKDMRSDVDWNMWGTR